MKRTVVARCAAALWLAPLTASALIMVGHGNAPVSNAGWAEGALAVANLQSRIGWWEGPPDGGGEWTFCYRGDTAALGQALAAFAAIRNPTLDLVIRDGPETNGTLNEQIDWAFTVWVPACQNRLFPPCLTVYAGGGAVDWAKVTVPPQLHVRDERASAAGVDLTGGSVVQAEFIDMDTRQPVKEAHLIVDRMTLTTNPAAPWTPERVADKASDASGRVRIEKIAAGNFPFWLHATAGGYAPRLVELRSLPRPALAKYTVELAKAARLSGMVTDPEGKPFEGARVHLYTLTASNGQRYDNGQPFEPYDKSGVETDETGHFEMPRLAAGHAQLSVTARGYYFGDTSTRYDVPSDRIQLHLKRAGGIEGRVTDKSGEALAAYGGRPLMIFVGAKDDPKVGAFYGAGGAATVKGDGTFEFEDLPPGEYRLNCQTNGLGGAPFPEQIVTVKPGAPVAVKFVYE